MSWHRVTSYLATLTAISIIILTVSAPAHAGMQVGIRSEPIELNKPPEYITDVARDFLTQRDGDTATVWVFFTDKNVFNQREFLRTAASVNLTDRALKRRSKVDKDRILFVDLPVPKTYIDQIVATGAVHRRTSRWLNAASFELPMSQLDQVGSLPFVAFIKPVFRYQTSEPVEVNPVTRPIPPAAQSPDALSYGGSLDQLNQINVLPVHARGYRGQGVTLAIMDTGFRKSHEAFAQHLANNRVLGEYDFVFNDSNTSNEPEDWSSAWFHGTLIWSVSAGEQSGRIYGPAYNANIILCKTEDVRSESTAEEDNWVAALEYADSIGTDVITTSLGYGYPGGWYTYSDLDGQTATISIAASTCDSLGIVMCNSMGNSGPSTGSLSPPADAFGILSIGAVNDLGFIASFSGRGPTYDGRPKPDVVALGVGTYAAYSSGDNDYTEASGTSLSTPLVAGAAAVLVGVRPQFPPELIRRALRETASKADNPDSTTYGYGIINLDAATRWGADFAADTTLGNAPLTVSFSGISPLTVSSWSWDFGDGGSADVQNPTHEFTLPGSYTVTLTVETDYGTVSSARENFIIAMGDTLAFESDSVFAGAIDTLSVSLYNSQALNRILVPFDFPEGDLDLSAISVARGDRTAYFERMNYVTYDPGNERYVVELVADDGGGAPPLDPGQGEVLKVVFTTGATVLGGLADTVTTGTTAPSLQSALMTYEPTVRPGEIATKIVRRCDVDYSNDGIIDIGDLTELIAYLYLQGPMPPTVQSADCDANLIVDIGDITYLIAYLYLGADPPQFP